MLEGEEAECLPGCMPCQDPLNQINSAEQAILLAEAL